MRAGSKARDQGGSLFGGEGVVVSAIVQAGEEHRVKAGRATLAVLTARELSELGVEVGTAWTTDLAERARVCARAREGLRWCLRWLRTADRSVHELRERLAARGFAQAEAERATALLAQARVQSDAELSERLRGKLSQQGASDAKIDRTLRAKGLAIGLANGLKADSSRDQTQSERARALALASKALGKDGPPAKRVRRALAALARAEFEEELALEVVREAATHAGLRWDVGGEDETD